MVSFSYPEVLYPWLVEALGLGGELRRSRSTSSVGGVAFIPWEEIVLSFLIPLCFFTVHTSP